MIASRCRFPLARNSFLRHHCSEQVFWVETYPVAPRYHVMNLSDDFLLEQPEIYTGVFLQSYNSGELLRYHDTVSDIPSSIERISHFGKDDFIREQSKQTLFLPLGFVLSQSI